MHMCMYGRTCCQMTAKMSVMAEVSEVSWRRYKRRTLSTWVGPSGENIHGACMHVRCTMSGIRGGPHEWTGRKTCWLESKQRASERRFSVARSVLSSCWAVAKYGTWASGVTSTERSIE